MSTEEEAREIARLNDAFRETLSEGYVVLHRTIRHWSRVCEVLDGLRVVPGNADEPLRDTGSLQVAGKRVVWKIHYYERLGRFRCRPLDADCIRVLTAMVADGFHRSAQEFWNQLEQQVQTQEVVCKQSSMSTRQRLRAQMTSFAKRAGA